MIAIDTSRSMGANDVRPTRLAAAQASARRFLAELPGKYRVAVVAFSSTRAARGSPDAEPRRTSTRRSARCASAQGTALGDAHRDVGQGRRRPRRPGEKQRAGQPPPPAAILVLSDGAAGRRERQAGRRRRAGRARRRYPSSRRCWAPRRASCRCRTSVATSSASRCRRTPPRSAPSPRRRAEATSPPRRRRTSRPVYADLKSRLGKTRKNEEITVAFAGAGVLFLLVAGALSAMWFRRVP